MGWIGLDLRVGWGMVDCPTQLTLIFIFWYLYLSVFHDKYQSYKYERNTAGKSVGSVPDGSDNNNTPNLFIHRSPLCKAWLFIHLVLRCIGGAIKQSNEWTKKTVSRISCALFHFLMQFRNNIWERRWHPAVFKWKSDSFFSISCNTKKTEFGWKIPSIWFYLLSISKQLPFLWFLQYIHICISWQSWDKITISEEFLEKRLCENIFLPPQTASVKLIFWISQFCRGVSWMRTVKQSWAMCPRFNISSYSRRLPTIRSFLFFLGNT